MTWTRSYTYHAVTKLTQKKEPKENSGTEDRGKNVDRDVAIGKELPACLRDVLLGEQLGGLIHHQLAQLLHHPPQQVCHCLAL